MHLQKWLIMTFLQKCKTHTSLQFGRCRSNRFDENRLTGTCRAVFSKQATPRSHAFFSGYEPLSPSTHCGELRGGISSHPPGMARNLRPVEAAAESASLHRMKTARSTEFPLRRLAVRGCERTMSGAKRRAPMAAAETASAVRRSVREIAEQSNQRSRQPE